MTRTKKRGRRGGGQKHYSATTPSGRPKPPWVTNSYGGWKPKRNDVIPTISNDITPQQFYQDFVVQRKPVIIDGHIKDPSWKGSGWTLKYITEKAKEANIQVEKRSTTNSAFGLAAEKIEVSFQEFASNIESESYYLTTQKIPQNESGYDNLFAEPLTSLQSEFPWQPSLLGNLIPYQMNLWIGKTSGGSSSGLHHDFHDNLYVLLSGKKTFHLYSPWEARNLYLRGKIQEVHKNGLISYSDVPTRSDGASPIIIASVNTQRAEQKLAHAETLYENICEGNGSEEEKKQAAELVQQAENALENAMETSLMACEEENEIDNEPETGEGDVERYPNFSTIKPSLTRQQKKTEYPFTAKATEIVCEVKEGQMLYLPASWFHEVTSRTSEPGKPHMAMNYWCYPPCLTSTFNEPYVDSFWADKYKQFLASQQLKEVEKQNAQIEKGEEKTNPLNEVPASVPDVAGTNGKQECAIDSPPRKKQKIE